MEVDRRFPRRVVWASLVFGHVLVLFLYALQLEDWALGIALGAAVGIYSFDVFRIGVRTFLRPEQSRGQHPIPLWKKVIVGALFFMKLPIWIVTIYVGVTDPNLKLLGFVGGLVLPQFVMFTKVISKWVVGEQDVATEDERTSRLTVNNNAG